MTSKIIIIKNKKIANFYLNDITEDVLVPINDQLFTQHLMDKNTYGLKITTNNFEKYGPALDHLLQYSRKYGQIRKPLLIYINGFTVDIISTLNEIKRYTHKAQGMIYYVSKSKHLIKSFGNDYERWINILKNEYDINNIMEINFDYDLI